MTAVYSRNGCSALICHCAFEFKLVIGTGKTLACDYTIRAARRRYIHETWYDRRTGPLLGPVVLGFFFLPIDVSYMFYAFVLTSLSNVIIRVESTILSSSRIKFVQSFKKTTAEVVQIIYKKRESMSDRWPSRYIIDKPTYDLVSWRPLRGHPPPLQEK